MADAAYDADPLRELTLEVPVRHDDPNVRIKQASDPGWGYGWGYGLEEVLFRAGIREPLEPFADIQIRSPADVQAWFTSVAALLRQHCGDLFADRPDAFDSLAAASDEREQLINEACERRYAELHGRPYDGPRPDDPG